MTFEDTLGPKTYEMAKVPPPPMPWQEYEARVPGEWKRILDRHEGDERAIHTLS
jgi:hypothetical protein